MKSSGSQDVSVLCVIPHNKWIQGVVQKVLAFGLIVRPAGYYVTGMVHQSQIPRGLINALRKRVTIIPGQNKSDVENFFHEGDVIKMRVQSVSTDSNKIELSMQPISQSEEDDDDYVVEGRETDEEAEEAEREAREREDDSISNYDPEALLLWWNGEAYHKIIDEAELAAVDEELEVVNESEDIVEGTWRRLFEIDMREDEADFSSKATELDLKEQDEEIGELSGLDNDMIDSIGFGTEYKRNKLGAFVSLNSLPEEWKNQLNFIKELDTEETQKQKGLRAGKAGETIELNSLVQKMEKDAQDALQSRQARNTRQEAPAEAAPAAAE
jgi:predicted RNA-binding protein with RPS1 domain